MFLTHLFESKQRKHVAFCFGRMNPPTIGHARLLNTVARASAGGDYFIFLSHTQDAKKNPLDYLTKFEFIEKMFPQHAGHIAREGAAYGTIRTIMDVAAFLYNRDYTDVTFVCGDDRIPAFKKLLNDYNGREGGNTYYKFNSINIVSSGPRDPDDDGIAGASASAARAAAAEGNKAEFKKITGAGRFAPALYKAVRQGMNLAEDASGYIPKNKKEAKDPRWSTALTVDVHPDTPYKNAKAFKLVK